MEILLAYALLLCEGYDVWDEYSKELDELFLADPKNEMYLYLETTTDMKQAVMHILSAERKTPLDYETFGKALMKLIGDIYQTSDLHKLTKWLYSLWSKLPAEIDSKEPFSMFNYLDDVLEFNGEADCRRLLEEAIHYYT